MSKPGWDFLWNSKVDHYFEADCRSLCGRWMTLGAGEDRTQLPTGPTCKACLQKRMKQLKHESLSDLIDRGDVAP